MIASSVVFLHKHGLIDKALIDGYKKHVWIQGENIIMLQGEGLMFPVP